MESGQRRPQIPDSFDSLDKKRFFSLGQDVSYYQRLNELKEDIRHKILNALNDVALDPEIYIRARQKDVMRRSLLRNVTTASVKGQFRRLAHGDATLTHYKFTYSSPEIKERPESSFKLSFEVEPSSMPPTNLHIIIGRNGVGKTHLINSMVSSLVESDANKKEVGQFIIDTKSSFANLVSVSFSAFDTSIPYDERRDENLGIRYAYIGLKQLKKNKEITTKSIDTLIEEFVESARICTLGAKVLRWKEIIERLEADPIFREVNITQIAGIENKKQFRESAAKLFEKLSSGHMIVLLTITRLVETVEEQTLVLLNQRTH
ncbi:hypothetical protein [Evansella clarkii]|uniref:hypothetical protein n=1 Tax=Evansella clarkii TaxID=79879 RepID=UPI00099609DE|nr:hypothetical protein [Evansella clarkii]